MVLPSNKSKYKGFSLIEMLVSLSLFTIVSVIVVGTILVLVNGNKKLQGEQQVMVGLSSILDNITREIRTGSFYYCADSTFSNLEDLSGSATMDCVGGEDGLAFREGIGNLTNGLANDRIAYYRKESGGVGVIYRKVSERNEEALTPANVDIRSLNFYVNGTEQLVSDNNIAQPTVTIVIEARDLIEGSSGETFTVQATVTQRVLDI